MKVLLRAPALLLLGSVALAQTDASSKLQPITTQVKKGGTYHAATKTWTRNATPTANLTGLVLYDNTCTVGFFIGLSAGESLVDSGRIPSTTSPTSATSLTGNADNYVVDGFEVAYCTSEAAVTLEVAHYECYGTALCVDQTLNTTLVSALAIVGAPASALSGSLSCWGILINLRNSTFEFPMNGDCDGVFGPPPIINDTFGWEYFEVGGGVNGFAGPIIAGDPFGLLGPACPYGAGTKFTATPGPGTGLSTQDAWTNYLPGPSYSAGALYAGCFFFGGYTGGNLYGSFYHQIRGTKPSGPSRFVLYCDGDGSGTPCPCGNNNDGSNGVAGCANSAVFPPSNGPGGATLRWTGTNSISSADLSLTGAHLPTGLAGLYLQGNNATNGGLGTAFGDGLRCAGGGVIRLQVRNSGPTGSSFTTVNIAALGLVNAGDVKRYQLWYRDNPGLCGSGFNFTNGLEITWKP